MIEILEIKLPFSKKSNGIYQNDLSQNQNDLGQDDLYQNDLYQLLKKKLHIDRSEIRHFEILKRSIDARKKPDLFYIYSLLLSLDEKKEAALIKKSSEKKLPGGIRIRSYQKIPYLVQTPTRQMDTRPVVVGAGPAGLFSALILARAGLRPILIERGDEITERTKDVEKFFQSGKLDPESNVQFGEGGAGAFSDGKLNTQVHDKEGRNRFVLETFVKAGARPEILYDPKPHVGTDKLVSIVANIRKEIQSLGGEVRFRTRLIDFTEKDGKLISIQTARSAGHGQDGEGKSHAEIMEEIPCNDLILAIGHSARDTFRMLYGKGLPMKAKQFAVGFRVEHPQDWLNLHQYGFLDPALPAASYKLACNLDNGRSIYSFCMCPGGYVENSSSEEGQLLVNGMSYSARDSKNCNSAIIVSVGEKEYSLDDPLAAIEYQKDLEIKAYRLAGGKIPQQLLSDYRQGIPSKSYGDFPSVTRGETELCNLRGIFSPEIEASFLSGMEAFDRKIRGFNRKDAILSGVESRTSSPIRIERDANGQTSIQGIYPCGEGAGYAGGIMSAAMDGMKMAEKLILRYSND